MVFTNDWNETRKWHDLYNSWAAFLESAEDF